MRFNRKISVVVGIVAILVASVATSTSTFASNPNVKPKASKLSPRSAENIHRRPDAFVPNEAYCNSTAKQWIDVWADANFEGRKVRWCVTDSLNDNSFRCGPLGMFTCIWGTNVSSVYFSWRRPGTNCYWKLFYDYHYEGAQWNLQINQASGNLNNWNDRVRSFQTMGTNCAS